MLNGYLPRAKYVASVSDVVIISAYLCLVTRAYALYRPWAFYCLNPISSYESLPSPFTCFHCLYIDTAQVPFKVLPAAHNMTALDRNRRSRLSSPVSYLF